MPIYEYQCQECQHRLEALQQLSEPPLTTCPECQGELRKLFSAPAFQFKGSGWYVTDYARKDGETKAKRDGGGEAAPAKAETGDTSAASGSKETTTPSKPTKTAAGAGG